jgi:hypothetical protein
MKDTYYFTHDYNARTDSRIKNLIRRHKMLGYGIYWAIIEDLYQNANALPLDCVGIAFDLHTDKAIIESIIYDFDLFVVTGNTFGSNSVQRRLEYRNEKSNKARQSALNRWNKDANAMRSHSDGNAINKSKVNNSKVNKYNFRESLIGFGFEPKLVDEWLVVRKQKKGVNSETAFTAFAREVEKTGVEKNAVLQKCIERSWCGFEANWLTPAKTTPPVMDKMQDERFLK